MEKGLELLSIIINQFGWLGNWLFLLIALLECVPFVGGFFPGGTLVSAGAFLAAQGDFNPYKILLFAFIGAVIGDYLGFFAGYYGGKSLIGKNVSRLELLKKGEGLFQRYGARSIVWGRFFGATRALIPFLVGSYGMKPLAFPPWNILGAAIWAMFTVGFGYFSGSLIVAIWHRLSHGLSLVIIAILAISAVIILIRRHQKKISKNFSDLSLSFSHWLFKSRLFDFLDDYYPEIKELSNIKKTRVIIFWLFLWLACLSIIYLSSLVLDII